MTRIPILEDLYQFNSWACDRIFSLCEGLSDEQLDEPHEMGFGSLRNTLFHILAAEEIWFERWNSEPWRPFQADAKGSPLQEIRTRLNEVARKRRSLMETERSDGWSRIVHYKDGKGYAFSQPLSQLALHVANHGIHHRAQALSYLKRFGRTVSIGLDYLFYRFARPFITQDESSAVALRQFGLEVATGSSPALAWDADTIRDYFAYGDWANARALTLVTTLDDAGLDRSWSMGLETIRRTVLHILDAERWWLTTWMAGPSMFEQLPVSTSIAEVQELWQQVISGRDRFIQTLDAESSQRVVTAVFGEPLVQVPVIESMVQQCGHGTHHRAQLINMLRHSHVSVPEFDYIFWLRERPH